MIRAAIADDEPLARRGLKIRLEAEPGVTVVSMASNGKAALEAVREHRPDVLFLDIRMPDLPGFEVVSALGDGDRPLVVFVTAFDEHAVAAFDANAIDYLLKPFDQQRLRRALRRVNQALEHRAEAGRRPMTPALGYADRIALRDGSRLWFLRTGEVDWLEARGNYIRVWSGGAFHLIRDTLAGLAARLDPAEFVRVNRSAMVNLGRVKEFRRLPGGRYIVRLANGMTVESSRRLGQALAVLVRSSFRPPLAP